MERGRRRLARRLAARLGWKFADCDDLVEHLAGRTVAEIFAAEGEAGFRIRESAALEFLCRQDRLIIATGGGAVLREANRVTMKRAGFVVWLTAPAETIHLRLNEDPTTAARRPNLTTGGLGEIVSLLTVREPLYREVADLVLESGERSPDELADNILAALPLLGEPGA